MRDLADVPFLIPSSSDRSYVDWAIADPRPGGRRPRVGPVVRNFDEALANVAADLGVYLVPKAVADAVAHVGVVARAVEDVEPSPYLMCYLERNARDATRPMGRALSPVMSDYFAQAHRTMGTDLRLDESLAALAGRAGAVVAAVGTSGREYPADVVLVGVGVCPRDELARDAGLAVDNGIVVDAHLRTTDPAVYAVGDCVSFPVGTAGHRVRLESVQNATDQGRHVADMILGGDAPYAALPWFWSNQGPLRLQIAGLTRPGDSTVVSGDVRSGRFSVFCFRGEQLVAVESLNRPADHVSARRVLTAGPGHGPGEVARPGFSLKDHAKQVASTH